MFSARVVATDIALRRAAVRAVRAPSVHNTQPWRLEIGADSLTVLPDRTRHVPVFDPSGRQLLLSVGCAAANAQIALAADGMAATLHIGPPGDPWPRIYIELESAPPDEALAALDAAIDLRSTPRTPLTAEPVTEPLLRHLQSAAAFGGVEVGVVPVDDRLAVERLARIGNQVLCTYPDYLAELSAWTTERTRADGLRASAFDVLAAAQSQGQADDLGSCDLLWIATRHDDPIAWVEAGVALERVLLELTRAGLAAVPLAQIVEVPTQRTGFAAQVGTAHWTQAVLRVGRATVALPTRRRRLVEVIM